MSFHAPCTWAAVAAPPLLLSQGLAQDIADKENMGVRVEEVGGWRGTLLQQVDRWAATSTPLVIAQYYRQPDILDSLF